MKDKQPGVLIRCIGDKKEPSKAAVDRFISIYFEMVKENQKKKWGECIGKHTELCYAGPLLERCHSFVPKQFKIKKRFYF